MSRASTTPNLLLAAMFLVSLVPATTAATDPATDEQENAIEVAEGIDVPSNLPWTHRSELHVLYLHDDGTLALAGGRWIQVDPFRFVNERGTGYVVFRPDESGEIRELFAGGFWGWRKI